ncbi:MULTISPECIES: ATP-binding protein [Helicobacter]|uniref:histidine kinase n=1 Tax=Helicobacter colisuis TaxID=2949739 RepID=A0ABT0TW17_9HELI|nr:MULTISPECIES: ATP-binding protein [unclassified Helicobacter]MCI2235466.1 ATP-binding protein [Helicobacter sp. CaF467b]MCL9820114.1 ATP-binding protein [Helicobacter colisuis]MCI7047716.1 ATP-binding protein [Helicobacter sp.]MCI7764894.1 ATP-binding protein [Helicobacter sp.]MCL9820878.1 ATP-binding protein [Helicobacter colisuis]
MIDQNLLESLSSSDKESFAKGLKELITQTYEVEKEFIELKALFEEVLDILPTAVWVLEQGGEIFYQNSLASEIPELLEAFDLQKTKRQEIELDSKVYLVQTNQKLNKIIISATDITSEKRRERLASMGQISAHLAHEIRNPVGSVALLASTLLKRVDIKNKTLVLEIKKSIWRVERIIKATLLFSKGVHIQKSKIDPQKLQDELEESLSYYTYSKNIHFAFDFSGESFEADFDLLCIVLQNFLFNAIDAIEEGEEEGAVEISYQKTDKGVVFRIFDNGKPIENPQILFEPFKSTKLKGNGLGLALSLQIIQAHEGSIELLAENKKGFEILLPQSV